MKTSLFPVLLFLYVVPVIYCSICASDRVLIHYFKRTGNSTIPEKFYLYDPETDELLFTSPVFTLSITTEQVLCVPKTQFSSYHLVYSTPEWHRHSVITFQNSLGSVVYKNHYDSGIVLLTFYIPLLSNSQWWVSNSIEMFWTDYNWDIADTPKMEAINIAQYANGKHLYLRTVVRAPPYAIPAYEIKVKYKHGILIYLNGYTIFDDNIDTSFSSFGDTHSMKEKYSSYEYRGPIRNGYELGTSNVIIAIEIHADEVIQEFDAWLSALGSSWNKNSPLVYYYPTEEVSINLGGQSYESLCDFDYESISYTNTQVQFYFNISLGQCMGIMYYTYPLIEGLMQSVEVVGINSKENLRVTIFDRNIDSTYYVERIFTENISNAVYDKIRITPKKVSSYPVGFAELRPVVTYVSYKQDFVVIPDQLYEFKTYETIQFTLLNYKEVTCLKISPSPIGITVTSSCVLAGKTTIEGSFAIQVFVQHLQYKKYFTIHLSILAGESPNDKTYDSSYMIAPIIITVLFCLIVIIAALVLILLFIHPDLFKSKQRKQLKKSKPENAQSQ